MSETFISQPLYYTLASSKPKKRSRFIRSISYISSEYRPLTKKEWGIFQSHIEALATLCLPIATTLNESITAKESYPSAMMEYLLEAIALYINARQTSTDEAEWQRLENRIYERLYFYVLAK